MYLDIASDPTSATWGLGILIVLGLWCLVEACRRPGPPDDQVEHHGAGGRERGES
jgi:hypothetical protein